MSRVASRVARVLLLAALAVLLPCLVGRAQGAAPESRLKYELRVEFHLEAAYLTAVEDVSLTNATGDSLPSLVFSVPAAFFGGFSLSEASVDGQAVRATLDRQTLELVLAKPLAPGAQARVRLSFRQGLPPGDGRYGYSAGVAALGDWYPMLAVYRQGWLRYAYSDIGDPYFSEVADYDVTLTTSSPAVVVATGELVSHDANTWRFQARQVRDWAAAVSVRYRTQTRAAEGVTMTVAYLPEHAAGAARSLEVAAQCLQWYGTQVGRYPFSTLSIAATTSERTAHTAQEHSNLIFLRSDTFAESGYYLDILVAHEVAHQWFFGVVGNDQIAEPWLDEALVNAVALDFWRQRDTDAYKSMWSGWGGKTEDGFLNRGIYEFHSGTAYFDSIYRRGGTFLRDLQDLMGPGPYWKALRAYYSGHLFGIAQPQDLLGALRLASAVDPWPLYRSTFDYPFLKVPDPQITVTVPAQLYAGSDLRLPVQVQGPPATITATLDGRPVDVAGNTVLLAASRLTLGEHDLGVTALGVGIGLARKQARFTVVPAPPATATPSPPPTATPAPTPSAVPAVPATATPTVAARPSATPAGPPAVTLPPGPWTVWNLLAVLMAAIAVGALAAWRAMR